MYVHKHAYTRVDDLCEREWPSDALKSDRVVSRNIISFRFRVTLLLASYLWIMPVDYRDHKINVERSLIPISKQQILSVPECFGDEC